MMIDTPEKFWERVNVTDKPDECWEWKGSTSTHGYGDCTYQGVRTNAHRRAYILTHGEPDKGLVICHKCDNRKCCNHNHLWAGTQGDNVRDCVSKGRARGHFYGRNHPKYSAKLNEDDVLRIREMCLFGANQTDVSKVFGVHSSQISRIVTGDYWVDVGGARQEKSKLRFTDSQVREIRTRTNVPGNRIAEILGVGASAVSRVRRGLSYSHVK